MPIAPRERLNRCGLVAALLAALTIAAAMPGETSAQSNAERWVGAWGASPCRVLPGDQAVADVAGRTLRQIVHLSAGGDAVRVRLSNVDSSAPLIIGTASLGIQSVHKQIELGTTRPLTFGGKSAVRIPGGQSILSDPVTLRVAAFTNLAVSLYFPEGAKSPTIHSTALQSSWLSEPGDFAADRDMATLRSLRTWSTITAVEVASNEAVGTIVAFGDSITDGAGSTSDTNRRWPDYLARRLQRARDMPRYAVVNAGIGGNRVLNTLPGLGVSAVARFQRDALDVAGVTHVIVLEGINDIGIPNMGAFARNQVVSADEIIAGHRRLIEMAHARGVKMIGATLLPFEEATYYSEEGEAKRQAVNEWIRTGDEYEAVIDFEAAVRDPKRAKRLRADFTADFLHPNDAGYEAMAKSIDLAIFESSK